MGKKIIKDCDIKNFPEDTANFLSQFKAAEESDREEMFQDFHLDVDEKKFIDTFKKYDDQPEIPRIDKEQDEEAGNIDIKKELENEDKLDADDLDIASIKRGLTGESDIIRKMTGQVMVEEKGVIRSLDGSYFRRIDPPENCLNSEIPRELYGSTEEEIERNLMYKEKAAYLFKDIYGKGLPEEFFLDDQPADPNPLEIVEGEDLEEDPKKWRTEPYPFEKANSLQVITSEHIEPETWETQILGPHPTNRKAIITIKAKDLKLPLEAFHKLILLCGPRYNKNSDILKITCDKYPNRRQNAKECLDLLEKLYYESQKYTEVKIPRKEMAESRANLSHFENILAIANFRAGKTNQIFPSSDYKSK